ncbi:alpha-D-ribose 1-methylphosphonate 5-triphosphate diphosphatase [Niveibacterium sp. SC-1]|uniref:alpha-D-ribose 1-methylphosphonate 5-triphosphate diphosphatase n=1 Tax=Niveibacterium sp. SC-1 TaxID=3135646 RepID=UPI00311EDC6A
MQLATQAAHPAVAPAPAVSTSSLAGLLGGRVLRAEGQWDEAPLFIEEGRISDRPQPGRWLDARDCLVLPGIVDFHGDAFERQIMPRPGVRFPLDLALLDTDRQLAANGITTALHGVTYSWEGGLRGKETAEGLFDALDRLAPRLQVQHKVHLRFECHNVAGEADAQRWLRAGQVSLLAFNEHLPGMRRKPHKLQEYADRAGTDVAGFMALIDAAVERTDEVSLVVERLALQARRRGIPMASHDDPSTAVRDHYQTMGCHVSEFPLTREVARHAQATDSPVVCGAPNVLRGGSHVGAPAAEELAREGQCSILASDYYYPAPLHAALKLADVGALPLAAAWNLISHNPAQALGMTDRGRLAAGLRADALVLDARDPRAPRLVATVAGGRLAYLADGDRLHA